MIKTCKNCQEPLEDNWDECPACGNQTKEIQKCSSCGTEMKTHWIMCPQCKIPAENASRQDEGFSAQQPPTECIIGPSRSVQTVGPSKLSVMVWNGCKWTVHPLASISMASNPDYLQVTNTDTSHRYAKVIMNRVFNGDFIAELELSGNAIDLQLQAADGQDRNFYVSIVDQEIDISSKKRFTMYRKGGGVGFQRGSGQRVRYDSYQADPLMSLLLAIALPINGTVRIYKWQILDRN